MSSRIISTAEVNGHCSEEDSWIVVNGVVWDISGFAAKHPGGRAVIEDNVGRDASDLYNDVHSPNLIRNYLGEERRMGLSEQGAHTQDTVATRPASTSGPKPDLGSIISIHEFEAVARSIFKPKSWAYISGATEDGLTKAANADWYQRIWFRPRILNGVARVSTGVTILGREYASPIFNAPTSTVMNAHPDGELAWARALAACGNTIIIPTMSSYSVEEIVAALPPGHPFFFQLYVHTDRSEMDRLLKKVCEFKPQAILVTADLPVMTKREGYEKFLVQQERDSRRPARATDMPEDAAVDPDLKWSDVKHIRESTGCPVFVKGIQCAADALRAYECGCAGIYISNHGGRALDTAAPSILTLLEIQANCPQILDQMEVFIDGGIQRGTDILKAMCLGASAVCLGRAFLYALAYGEEGVKRAVEILEAELKVAMQLAGITRLDQAHPGLLITTDLDRFVYRGDSHPWARKPRRWKL